MTAEYELTNTESTNYQKPDQAAFSFEIGKADENEVQIVTVMERFMEMHHLTWK